MLEKMDQFFENRLSDYDRHMLTEVDGESGFYAYTASQLPQIPEAHILDLGCGTGLELERYFPLNPTAHVTGIDLSKAMLETLAAKFPHKNLTLIQASYFDADLGNEQYHAAVSVESLHHFTPDLKLSLYKKILQALKPKGYFILTDYFAESEELEREYFSNLENLKREQGITDNAFYHYDTPLTVEHEIEILKKAGFSQVEILESWGTTYTLIAER